MTTNKIEKIRRVRMRFKIQPLTYFSTASETVLKELDAVIKVWRSSLCLASIISIHFTAMIK